MKLVGAGFALFLGGCTGGAAAPVEHPAVAADAGEPTLVPTGLTADTLPINSIRSEWVGHDAAADLCVRAVWDFSNHHRDPFAKHCDDFFAGFPYVMISKGPCEPKVAYWGNATLLSGTGCVAFNSEDSFVDATLHVKSDLFTGAIRLASAP